MKFSTMAAVMVSTAVISGAVAGTASAATVQPIPFISTVTATAPTKVVHNLTFTVSSALRPAHGSAQITLQYWTTSHTWKTVSTVKTNSASNASWKVSTPVSRYYRVTYSGAFGFTAATSRTALVLAT